jgi:hypothetical protein
LARFSVRVQSIIGCNSEVHYLLSGKPAHFGSRFDEDHSVTAIDPLADELPWGSKPVTRRLTADCRHLCGLNTGQGFALRQRWLKPVPAD